MKGERDEGSVLAAAGAAPAKTRKRPGRRASRGSSAPAAEPSGAGGEGDPGEAAAPLVGAGRYDAEAAAANRLAAAFIQALEAEPGNHLAHVLALASVSAAVIRSAAAGSAAPVEEISDLLQTFTRQHLLAETIRESVH